MGHVGIVLQVEIADEWAGGCIRVAGVGGR